MYRCTRHKTSSSILCMSKDEVSDGTDSMYQLRTVRDACPSRIIPSRLADFAERHDKKFQNNGLEL
ncbi:MAG: hypothetical protein ACLU92_10125 [Coprococcus comes]